MNAEPYFIAKLILILFSWVFIFGSIVFILNANKIFKKLKMVENLLEKKRRDIIHNFVPVTVELSKFNKKVSSLLKINKNNLKEVLSSEIIPIVFKSYNFLYLARGGLVFIKNLLR